MNIYFIFIFMNFVYVNGYITYIYESLLPIDFVYQITR